MDPMNQTESQFYPRVFALAVAGLLAFAIFRIVQPFIGAILWGLLLAFLLFPVNERVRRALGGRRVAAAIVQGALVGIAFALVHLPSPLVFGVLAAVASLVPLVGASLVWAPAAVVIALQGRWVAALFLAVLGVAVVTSTDNVIRPRLIAGRA